MRENIILSRTDNSLNEILERIKDNPDKEFFVIGGSEIYKLFMNIADVVYQTVIKKDYSCDTFFPCLPLSFFKTDVSSFVFDENEKVFYYFLTHKKNVFQ